MQFECKEVLKLIDIHRNVCTFARIQLEKKCQDHFKCWFDKTLFEKDCNCKFWFMQ